MRTDIPMCRACGSAARRSARVARLDTSLVHAGITEFEYAGIIARLIALILDGIVLGILGGLASIPLLATRQTDTLTTESEFSVAAFTDMLGQVQLVVLGVILVYYVALLCTTGRTVGCYLTGIKVVDESGERLSPIAAVMRVLVANLSTSIACFGYVFGIHSAMLIAQLVGMISIFGYAMALWDRRSQTLHDKAAGSIVIRPAPVYRPRSPKTAPPC
jgi:uncharacterized RDD family membrane protein YckC